MQTTIFDTDVQVPVTGVLDPTEAPDGYRAEAKVYRGENVCRTCDWRQKCSDPATDLTAPEHRCMGYPVFTVNGRVVSRRDGCSVVFKRI